MAFYKSSKILPFYLKFVFLIVALQSMFAWFLWGKAVFILLGGLLITGYYFLRYKKMRCTKRQFNIVVFLLFIELYLFRDSSIVIILAAVMRTMIVAVLISLDDREKIEVLDFVTKGFAIIMFISLVAWVLFLLGIPLPNVKAEYNDGWYQFRNYYFFLCNQGIIDEIFLPRFSSVFLEPGHLGMIASFMLFVNQYNLKRKEVLVIFIAALFSFSLAAYLLIGIGYGFWILLETKHPFRYIFIILFCLISIRYFSVFYENGDNLLNELIFKRLEYDNGDFTGNNRFSEDFETFYDSFVQKSSVILGIGAVEYGQNVFKGGNAGYKVFVVCYGYVGVILTFIFYLCSVVQYRCKITWAFLALLALSFIQRAYPFWEVQLILFISSLPFLKNSYNKIFIK